MDTNKIKKLEYGLEIISYKNMNIAIETKIQTVILIGINNVRITTKIF